jgi:enoyl-CoA hydratase/carnithine racemase
MAESEDVLVEQDDAGIVTVTLNRPAKRNAVSFAMWQRLGALFTEFRERADVRIVILTGAGGHFSAGADISEFPQMRTNAEASKEYSKAGHAATVAIRDLPQPVIAAAHGYTMGGGCGLALACDIRIGDRTTQMGIPAAKRGIVYTVLDTENLLRAVGLSRAKLVLFSGNAFPAERCLSMGLLDDISEDGALEGALAMARELAQRAPLAQRGAKLTLNALAAGEAEERKSEIKAAQKRAANSYDYQEATDSFLEKRPPVFRGN